MARGKSPEPRKILQENLLRAIAALGGFVMCERRLAFRPFSLAGPAPGHGLGHDVVASISQADGGQRRLKRGEG